MSDAVIKVGDGRGFVIEVGGYRYVVTASHCLPYLPPAHPGADLSETTFKELLGPIGGPQTIWAECVFVNPVVDLAVLCTPDNQELWNQAAAFADLTDEVAPFALGSLTFAPAVHHLPDGSTIEGPLQADSAAQMLSLDGQWFSCRVTSYGRSLWIEDAASPIQPGMSGSPILTPEGAAIGVVCVSSGNQSDSAGDRKGGPNPALFAQLPAWLLAGPG